ncbi:hypothetical protein [Paenibacillus agricola]|uniref:Post-SET domain-containing protein n=1 Tax=Paenibacillus agricola TaxID=2716264 RepID=A0ABX0JBR1_9BACL|nr:hypothetical protein [Paenibacillus agricola]NHN33587.1 hypothetical protein [Paenibacillus agricola]
MFSLSYNNWSWDADLQIIHADVKLVADGDILIDEPLCVDVGLPALIYSISQDVEPYRWGKVEEWARMPFFCCGCGDPECRAFSFRVRHLDGGQTLELTELEERQHGEPREHNVYAVDLQSYRQQIVAIGKYFLLFVDGLDYVPYFGDTVKVVSALVKQSEQQ